MPKVDCVLTLEVIKEQIPVIKQNVLIKTFIPNAVFFSE